MRIKTGLFGCILAVLATTTTIGFAKDVDTYTGIVDLISIKSGQIIVNDHTFRLNRNFVVTNAQGKTISAFNVQQGSRIKVHLDEKDNVIKIDILK